MKKKLYTSLLAGTVITNSLGTTNVFAAPMAHPGQVRAINQVDISQFAKSLQNLAQDATVIKAYAFVLENQPAFKITQIPALNDTQDLIQNDMKKWRRDFFNARFLELKENSINLLTVFYTCIEEEILEEIQEKMQAEINDQQDTINFTKNELVELKTALDKHNTKLTMNINAVGKFLNIETGYMEELANKLTDIEMNIKTELMTISSTPGILVEAGIKVGGEVWNFLYPTMKNGTATALENMAATAKKLEEAKKLAIEEAKKDGGTVDINKISKKVEENFAKTLEGKAFVAQSLKKYDFMDKIDIDKVNKIIDTAAVGNRALLEQKNAILHLAEHNNQFYEVTRNLKAADIQATQLRLMASKVNSFVDEIDNEIAYLERMKNDWKLIEQAIQELPKKPTSSDLKTLNKLCKELEKQINNFENSINK